MQFDRGYLSPYFVTDADRMETVLENPYVLVHEKKISSMKTLLPIWRRSRNTTSAAIIVEDVDGDALATLVVNNLQKTMKAAVKAPGSETVAKQCWVISQPLLARRP